ncbi:MAG: beta-galactosidase [Candidatus Ratteibacteria bacterium]|nr:beta-galactosidase [Candidatus Ratteibacteria bacterium]
MFIGTQYYRPPFPEKRFWDDDLNRMKDAGIDVVQLWACWGWIEPSPGRFIFDDYDTLIEKAEAKGLKVVISTIAEIQPFWIERVVPEGVMIDHTGRKVLSSTRCECIVGITPGGCTDHPKVKEYMVRFLSKIGKRYGKQKTVIGWDCWNETRWCVHSDGYVCYCPETLNRFREFLKREYGEIEGLNRAWKRRYTNWADVYPGRVPDGRNYTECMEFLKFLTWRASDIMRFRAQALRKAGVESIISAHCGAPSILSGGWGTEQPLCRGNDWDFIEFLDGFGCSHFPFWGMFDDSEFGVRVEAIRSAVSEKVLWVSELQGGAARNGLCAHTPVKADTQQRWVWNAFGRGAKAVIFWCWRDEVFGRESGGFGIAGNDGLADERLEALKETSEIIKKYSPLLDSYKPVAPVVGVMFEPSNYYLEWSQYGNVDMAMRSLTGYLKALEHLNIPYEVVESSHLEVLKKLKFLFLPFPLVISEKTSQALEDFVKNGGVILSEADTGAFDTLGFYRYPGKERTPSYKLGIYSEIERQPIEHESFTLKIDGKIFRMKAGFWISPLSTDRHRILARDSKGRVIAVAGATGKGTVYGLGTFIGAHYNRGDRIFDKNFTGLIWHLLEKHGCIPDVRVHLTDKKDGKNLIYRYGKSSNGELLFIINPSDNKKAFLEVPSEIIRDKYIINIKEGKKIYPERKGKAKLNIPLKIQPGEWNLFLLKK